MNTDGLIKALQSVDDAAERLETEVKNFEKRLQDSIDEGFSVSAFSSVHGFIELHVRHTATHVVCTYSPKWRSLYQAYDYLNSTRMDLDAYKPGQPIRHDYGNRTIADSVMEFLYRELVSEKE